jgi:hypothetical protein
MTELIALAPGSAKWKSIQSLLAKKESRLVLFELPKDMDVERVQELDINLP